MLGDLKNEAKISVLLHTKSPLTIRSGEKKLLDPTRPDMQCVRSRYQGRDVVIIPGSSLKGVIRSRYEKIITLFGGECCNVFAHNSRCSKPKDWKNKSYKQKEEYVKGLCPACLLFGSTVLAARISIADAYPEGAYILGERNGIGINRITGASQNGALYDFEVVEEGRFRVKIILKNYELYQMKLLMYVLKDLDEGYISLGAAATRGNGRMEIEEMNICLREYRGNIESWKGVEYEEEISLKEKCGTGHDWKQQDFFREFQLSGQTADDVLKMCEKVAIEDKVKRGKQNV